MTMLKHTIPKHIHCFWHTPLDNQSAPRRLKVFLQCCLTRMKTLHPDYIVTLHTLDSMRAWKDYPTQIMKPYEKKRDYAHIADWLRLYLMYHKGGIWVDISSVFLYRVDNVCFLNDNRMQMYKAAWSQIIPESWFIVSPPGLPLTKKWLDEYTNAMSMSLPKYVASNTQYVVDDLRDRVPYLTLNVCFWKAHQTVPNSDEQYMLLASADEPGSPLHIRYAYLYKGKPGQSLPPNPYDQFWKGKRKEQRKALKQEMRPHNKVICYLCTTKRISPLVIRSFIKLTGVMRNGLMYDKRNFTTYRNHASAHVFSVLKFNMSMPEFKQPLLSVRTRKREQVARVDQYPLSSKARRIKRRRAACTRKRRRMAK
jgi:hypothetical protein